MFKLPWSMGHMMWKELGNILCNHDPKVKVKVNKRYVRCCIIDCILIVFCVQDVMTDETADSEAQAHQELHCLSIRPSVTCKSAYPKNNFLLSQPKCMLWVLKRTVSMRRFFCAPQTYAKT